MAERNPSHAFRSIKVSGTVDFSILGSLEVRVDGRPVELGRPKQRAVLAILLVHANELVPAERLIDELWGDDPPPHAVGSVQAYVSHLRRLLEPGRARRSAAGVLTSRPPGYLLVAGPDDVDAARFEALAARGHRLLGEGDPAGAADTLGEALRLWRGEVLADFPDAPFARAERARLEQARLAAVEDRITADLALGRHAEVVGDLDRLVRAHPYRESLQGLRMLALYRCGRQAEALGAYHETRRILAQDLGIDPSPPLTERYRQIIGQESALNTPGLVGRDRQLAELERALADAVGGRSRLVLVTGEAGVGKTRLAEELAERATGVTVAWGRCDEEPGAPPFWPWTEILRGLGAEAPEVDAGNGPPVVDVAAVRFRVAQAITERLCELAARRPLLIIVDDVQWADAGSLRVLPMPARRAARILVVATCREPATVELPPADRVALSCLDRADVRRLLTDRLGAEPGERLAGVVHDRSGGNPFLVVELVRLGLARAEHEVPAGVRDVLRHRFARLPEPVREVLLQAAVIGREFDLELIHRIDGRDPLDAAEEAQRAGLVTEEETAGRFRFTHALVREAVYDDASRTRRARLHARVAEALSARPDLAGPRGWVEGGEPVAPAAVRGLVAAADHALAVLAHEDAERHLHRAAGLLGAEPRSPERSRAELDVRMRLGTLHAQLHGARSEPGRAAVTRARELAEELGDGAALVGAYRSLYEVAVARAEHAEAAQLAERMLDVAGRHGDPQLQALAHLAAGRTAWCRGEQYAARKLLERGLVPAGTAQTPPHEALPVDVTLRLQLAPVLDLLGDEAAADDNLDIAFERTRGSAPLVRAGVFTSASLIAALRRDAGAAGRYAAEALALAGPLPAWFGYAAAVHGWTRALDGDPERGVRDLRASLGTIQASGARHLVAWVLGLLAEAEHLAGRPAVARTLLDDALTLVRQTGEAMYEAELHRLRAALLPDGEAALRTAVETARGQGAVLLARRAERQAGVKKGRAP